MTREDPISHISQAYPDRIEVRGRDLTGDLMGRLRSSALPPLLLPGREPPDDQRFFLDLLLVSIAEHGMMPTNVAARMTLAADPGPLQGAVAAGRLGARPAVPRTPRARPRARDGHAAAAAAPRARGGGSGGPRSPGSATRWRSRGRSTLPATRCPASATRCTGRSTR